MNVEHRAPPAQQQQHQNLQHGQVAPHQQESILPDAVLPDIGITSNTVSTAPEPVNTGSSLPEQARNSPEIDLSGTDFAQSTTDSAVPSNLPSTRTSSEQTPQVEMLPPVNIMNIPPPAQLSAPHSGSNSTAAPPPPSVTPAATAVPLSGIPPAAVPSPARIPPETDRPLYKNPVEPLPPSSNILPVATPPPLQIPPEATPSSAGILLETVPQSSAVSLETSSSLSEISSGSAPVPPPNFHPSSNPSSPGAPPETTDRSSAPAVQLEPESVSYSPPTHSPPSPHASATLSSQPSADATSPVPSAYSSPPSSVSAPSSAEPVPPPAVQVTAAPPQHTSAIPTVTPSPTAASLSPAPAVAPDTTNLAAQRQDTKQATNEAASIPLAHEVPPVASADERVPPPDPVPSAIESRSASQAAETQQRKVR
ncbi:unnamed protein product [Gongylonema pulchrum]|uniref:Vegetative cell wall protein gp1-like n=1 Tax=Gongylonema pulchrum TaxID=637853 RepID=A0A183EVR0_9BILA|nr:unnamed protein product [Gongylonema pulchrum]